MQLVCFMFVTCFFHVILTIFIRLFLECFNLIFDILLICDFKCLHIIYYISIFCWHNNDTFWKGIINILFFVWHVRLRFYVWCYPCLSWQLLLLTCYPLTFYMGCAITSVKKQNSKIILTAAKLQESNLHPFLPPSK